MDLHLFFTSYNHYTEELFPMKTYLRYRVHDLISVKELIALEWLDFDGKYKEYSEAHNFWELCFVKEGNVIAKIEARSFQLTPGYLLLIPPNRRHSYLSPSGNASQAFVMCFESFSQALHPLGEVLFQPHSQLSRSVEQIIDERDATFRTGENEALVLREDPRVGGQQVLILHLTYLLICMLRRFSSESRTGIVFLDNEAFEVRLTEEIRLFLREHLREQVSLDTVCKRFNYSRSFLCKVFKAQTGKTIISCFNEMKIAEAKRLLDATSMSPGEAAAYLGFGELKYFDTMFKKHTGLCPSAYRQQINKQKG